MKELVSIIMPSYNTAEYISEAIESVLAQTYSYWELIIVDDCSTDNTDEIVKMYLSDERIKYIKNKINRGAAISRNRALREARGRWIAFLDSDDIWLPCKLKIQIEFMLNKKCSFSYTEYEEINECGIPVGIKVSGPKKLTKIIMHCYCWPGCLTVMYDRNVIGNIQITDIKKNNDYAMWLKVCRKTEGYLCPTVLAKYRIRKGSISNHGYFKLLRWHYKLFRESEEKNILCAIIYTGINVFFGIWKKIFYRKSLIDNT